MLRQGEQREKRRNMEQRDLGKKLKSEYGREFDQNRCRQQYGQGGKDTEEGDRRIDGGMYIWKDVCIGCMYVCM